jgi:hypothetical protein
MPIGYVILSGAKNPYHYVRDPSVVKIINVRTLSFLRKENNLPYFKHILFVSDEIYL